MPVFSLHDARFEAPAGYGLKVVVATTQPGGSAIKNVSIGREPVPAGATKDAIIQAQLEQMKAQIPGFAKLADGTLEIGGQEHPLVESTAIGPDGQPLTTMTAWVLAAGHVYTLTASAQAAVYDAVKDEYRRIFSSFKAGA